MTRLLMLEILRERGRLFLVALAVAACVGTLTGISSLLVGVYTRGVQPLLPTLPVGYVKVEGRSVDVGLFSLSGLGAGLDEGSLQRLTGIAGVTAVYPVKSAGVPLRAGGGAELLGREVRTDVFATGVAPELVADDVADRFEFAHREDGPLPVVVSGRLLDLYNSTVAPVLDKPKLSREAALGFQFELIIGTSVTRGGLPSGRIERRVAEVVGLSDRANLAGITLPVDTIDAWSRRFEVDAPVTGAWVRVERPELVGRVAEAVERAGFRVDRTPKLIGWALGVAVGVGGIVAALVLGLAVLAIALAFRLMVAQRRTDLAILRALGARRRDLLGLVLGQALAAGTAGAIGGLALGTGLAFAGQAVLQRLLEGSSIAVDGWLAFPPAAFGAGLLIGWVASLLGAIGPAWSAARADPVDGLRG